MDTLMKDQEKMTFFSSVLDGMVDMVRVVDLNHTVILMNNKMKEAIEACRIGEKCFSIFGVDHACSECISVSAIHQQQSFSKLETFRGRTYSVVSSPIRNHNGTCTAAVEVFRDITEEQKLHKEVDHHVRKLTDDLQLASKIQQSFLPEESSIDYPFNFHALYKPCEHLGGDCYDIFRLDEDHIAFYIADVSGHGVTAGILAVFLKEAVLYRVRDENNRINTPAQVLEGISKRFVQIGLDQQLYITIFYGLLHTKTGMMTYSNAGHNVPPLVMKDNTVSTIEFPGIPICRWFDNITYRNKEIKFEKGMRILLLTDGIIEQDREMAEYELQKLIEFLELHSAIEGKELLDRIWNRAREANHSELFSDDVTLFLMENIL